MTNQQNMNLALDDLSVCSVATSTDVLFVRPGRQVQRFSSRLAGLQALIATWRLRHNTRGQLACADPAVLGDVGISEAQRVIEVNKSFWEA
jgi:uncharacterized protein YjiS (DUF1127 family)